VTEGLPGRWDLRRPRDRPRPRWDGRRHLVPRAGHDVHRDVARRVRVDHARRRRAPL